MRRGPRQRVLRGAGRGGVGRGRLDRGPRQGAPAGPQARRAGPVDRGSGDRADARGPLDLIYSCGSLHYVARDRRAALFARLRAVTRPGGHHAHLVFTDRLVHEEKGEIVEYYRAGELREAFVEWQILKGADHVISCAQDGTAHGHAVEEIVAARPVGPAPWPSEP